MFDAFFLDELDLFPNVPLPPYNAQWRCLLHWFTNLISDIRHTEAAKSGQISLKLQNAPENKPFSPKGKANVSFATNCSRGFCNPFQGVTYHCKTPKT